MRGLPTVLITLDPEQSRLMRPPRAVYPPGQPFGQSTGPPGEAERQRRVVQAALQRLPLRGEPGVIAALDPEP